jgi:hypothetical protein
LKYLTSGLAFYGDPKNFNDPLDTAPDIITDLDLANTVALFGSFMAEQGHDNAAIRAKANNLAYYSGEYGGDYRTDPHVLDYLIELFKREIKGLLDNHFKSLGVLSLSATWNSPLLWSHYADEHRGICIEYKIDQPHHARLQKVEYGATRSVRMSDLKKWKVDGLSDAETVVWDAYFRAKSPQWSYEREWRDIADDQDWLSSRFDISSVLFGFRCEHAVVTSIVRLLANSKEIKLYRICPDQHSFRLLRKEIRRDSFDEFGLQRSAIREFLDAPFPDIDEQER